MKIIIAGDDEHKRQWISTDAHHKITWIRHISEIAHLEPADTVIDLLFQPTTENISILENTTGTVIINGVVNTLTEINSDFIRINGWKTFDDQILEASGHSEERKQEAEKALAIFHKEAAWLPDEPGFISARVISMIINEAYIAVEEGVSSRDEIDTALKLGTNYPFGPFEWAEKIGIKNVVNLLLKLSESNKRYVPSALLRREAEL